MAGVETDHDRASAGDDPAPERPPRARWLLLAVALPAVWQVGALASIVAARAGYPMDLEWMEGGQLYHAHRLIEGQQIYAPPSDGFLPFPYPPAHYVVLAGAGRVIGLDYAMARVISALFVAGACWLLGREVARAWSWVPRPLPLVAGLVAVGTVVVTYPDVSGWFDLVRNDSMAIALAVAGAALCSRPRLTVRRAVAAACVLVVAVMTKQTVAFLGAWVAVWVVLFHRRAAPAFVGTLAATGLAGLAVLQIATDGWFWRHAVTSLAGDELSLDGARSGLDTIATAAPYLVVTLGLAIAGLSRDRLTARGVLWAGMLVAAFPAALLPMAKAGGAVNGVLPVLVLAGPVTLILTADLLAVRAAGTAGAPSTGARWRAVATLSAGALFVLLNPIDRDEFVPDQADWRRAEELNDYITGLEGGVLVPSQPFLAVRNGQDAPQVHIMGYVDAADMQGRDLATALAWMSSTPASEREPGSVPGWLLASFVAREQPRWIVLGSPIDHLAPALGWLPSGYLPAGRVPAGARPPGDAIWPDRVYERAEPDDR